MGGFLIVMNILIGQILAKLDGCDYFQPLQSGDEYLFTWPRFYVSDCRWAAEAPPGYKVHVACREVYFPFSFYCKRDRILVSTTGRGDLLDGIKHCAPFSETSTSTKLTMAVKTGSLAVEGDFKCSLKAVANSCSCGHLNRGRIGELRERQTFGNDRAK